jgi:hypothetical protein
MKAALQYAWLTVKHKLFVYVAGRSLGLGRWQLLIHDLSKFSLAELPAYGRAFFGDKGDPEGFARAWLHHQNFNPHHWEYWMPRSGHVKDDPAMKLPPPLEMPEKYAREMVADWLGASRGYTGSWNMTDWLDKNLPRIEENLHPKTRIFVRSLVDKRTKLEQVQP